MTRIWKWRLWVAIAMTALFAFIDVGFFASNIVKVFEGGWASLVVAFAIILGMAPLRNHRLFVEDAEIANPVEDVEITEDRSVDGVDQ